MANINEGSQEKRLHGYIIKCYYVFALGIALFCILLLSNHIFSVISKEQIEDTYYLNMFRNSSKKMTVAITSYVGSGNDTYKEDYLKEIEEHSREIAFEKLKNNNLKEEELAELERIVKLSNDLVPNEELAFDMIENGLKYDARAMIFSNYYKNTIKDINNATDTLIEEIVKRLERLKNIARIFQIISEIMVVGALSWFLHTLIVTVRFVRNDILMPVVKVSDQLMAMSEGDLHQKLDLKEDDTEVGRMAKAIRTMKTNWSDMIYEIAYSLEEMSVGNYVLEFSTEYVGEFITIKECLIEIVEGMRNIIKTISEVSYDIDQGARGLSNASESLAEACSKQAWELSDVLMYLHGITETTKANEKDAEEAVKISHLARSTVDLEEQRIGNLRQTLDDVTHCIEEMSAIIEMISLNEDTQKIIENALNSLNATLESTNQAMDELEDIRLGTEETTQRTERIVNNFNEEIKDIDKITENLSLLAGLVDDNSATAEETAAISEQQKSHASNLIALIEKFKI